MKSKVGIIGVGNMGGAIYRQIPKKFQILAYDPYIKETDIPLEKDLDILIESCDTILLCVKPETIIPSLKRIETSKNILSIAAGVSLSTLKAHAFPTSKILRIMPNLPLIHGEGLLATFGDESLHPIAEELFENCGRVLHLKKEEEMDCVTGLSGSGPAFVFSFLHAMAEGGVLSGLSYTTSLEIAIQTLKGSAILLENELKKNSSTHPFLWRNKVTSPGGTTIAGIKKLEDGNFNSAVMSAVYAAFERSRELGK